MSSETGRRYIPNLIVIGVDGQKNADYMGRIWTQYREEPAAFDSMMELLRKAEQFYDAIAFPQRATLQRSFLEKSGTMPQVLHRVTSDEREERKIMSDIEENRGKMGTFIVQVKYRQNSTWQGEVTWAEKNRKLYFRSALELVQLMDQALRGEAADTETGEGTGGPSLWTGQPGASAPRDDTETG